MVAIGHRFCERHLGRGHLFYKVRCGSGWRVNAHPPMAAATIKNVSGRKFIVLPLLSVRLENADHLDFILGLTVHQHEAAFKAELLKAEAFV